MFEQVFKNIDDILHKDAGCGSELDYVEQTSWILFLKYLDDLEKDKETGALLSGKTHKRLIEPKFQWTIWAAPKLENGKIDHNAMTGDDLVDFVNQELFPYLKKFKEKAKSPDTIEYKIGETIYDGAVGSAGFLLESFAYLVKVHGHASLSTKDVEILQKKTFYGKEKKSLAYIIGIMNMILHGVEAPNIIHTNTLAENLGDIQEKDRYDIVLANPPFGGKERAEVQQNFPIKTGETAFLFLQHFIKILKAGGKVGVVIKNTFLSNTDNASVALRKELLTNCNLYTVLDLPGGTFTGAGVKTVVLFFEKGKATQKTWFYQLNLDRNLGKTNPLNEQDLAEFVALQKTQAESENSWTVNIKDIDQTTFDLSVKNPNTPEEAPQREPKEILTEMADLDKKSVDILKSISEML